MLTNIGQYESLISTALDEMEINQVIPRIWALDHTLWKPKPDEITNRLGWLDIAERISAHLPRLQDLAQSLRSQGYSNALLLGMGGSSLAPQVFRDTFGVKDGYLDLQVLDSTDPGAVLAISENLDLSKTIFIVSTKSGGTIETLSFFKYFYNQVLKQVGRDFAGQHFIAITDASSRLAELAEHYKFRDIFLNDPNIGGRYSALSYFGLVPAALIGMDLELLLRRAQNTAGSCKESNQNTCAQLGVRMAELAKAGRDKITFIISPAADSFGAWIEQLIAESTGKEGLGILPVAGEPVGTPGEYGSDRLFVYLQLLGDSTYDRAVKALENSGQPVLRLVMQDRYDIGGQFFLWEMATAVAGYRLGINPFDQPNVEAAKVLARQMVVDYQERGSLPEGKAAFSLDGISVYGELPAQAGNDPLTAFLSSPQPGAYLSLQAYVQPNPDTDAALFGLRQSLRERTKLAVTSGYGPRFLHSTGQLHKGDAGKGLFIQFTSDNVQDLPIPDEAGQDASSISFGILEASQALGDKQALLDAGRKVIRFHFSSDIPAGIIRINQP
jgi:glucose-6-phosphate isomerase